MAYRNPYADDQAAGLTSILSLTRTPGFALFANSTAFSRAAWERTVPDSVISFLSASAFTLRSASTDQCDVDSSTRWTVDRRSSNLNGFGITSVTLSNIALPEIAER